MLSTIVLAFAIGIALLATGYDLLTALVASGVTHVSQIMVDLHKSREHLAAIRKECEDR